MSLSTKGYRLLRGLLLLLSLAPCGCGSSDGSAKTPTGGPQKPEEADESLNDKPRTQVLLGRTNYDKAAPQLAVGKKATFKGLLSVASTGGKLVNLHGAEVYSGDKKPLQAVDVVKDFMANKEAAALKYKQYETPFGEIEIIIEGVVLAMFPQDWTVVLAGQ